MNGQGDDEDLRPIVHAAQMHSAVPPAGAGVPEKMQSAEEWRVLGERLRELNPAMYKQLFALLVMSVRDESQEKITESYFVT